MKTCGELNERRHNNPPKVAADPIHQVRLPQDGLPHDNTRRLI
jgi:hypothetical protein